MNGIDHQQTAQTSSFVADAASAGQARLVTPRSFVPEQPDVVVTGPRSFSPQDVQPSGLSVPAKAAIIGVLGLAAWSPLLLLFT